MGVSCAVLRFGMSAPLRLEVPVQRETERQRESARALYWRLKPSTWMRRLDKATLPQKW